MLHTRVNKKASTLLPFADQTVQYEIGVDEAGRGPMFGRIYAAAVVLPKDTSFDHTLMRDSKRISNRAEMQSLSTYIREHSIAFSVAYINENEIDADGISVANMGVMHMAIQNVFSILDSKVAAPEASNTVLALIDGNYFVPFNINTNKSVLFRTVVGGDRTYSSIAAASILAKCARDDYIDDLCLQFPDLDARYGLLANKGYGTKKHLDGINIHGISQFHRKTYGACKIAPFTPVAPTGEPA